MLTLYYVALGIGGTLLLATLVMGGDNDHDVDHDVDFDADVDMDVDVDADADVDHDIDHHVGVHDGVGADAILGWLPLTSVRFWMFFLAFFGVTGTVMTLAKMMSSTGAIAGISSAVGYISGMGIVLTMRSLKKNQADSAVKSEDYIGETATVLVPVGKDNPGKVRVELRGRHIDLLAVTEEDKPFGARDRVTVYAMTDDGMAVITRTGHELPAKSAEPAE